MYLCVGITIDLDCLWGVFFQNFSFQAIFPEPPYEAQA